VGSAEAEVSRRSIHDVNVNGSSAPRLLGSFGRAFRFGKDDGTMERGKALICELVVGIGSTKTRPSGAADDELPATGFASPDELAAAFRPRIARSKLATSIGRAREAIDRSVLAVRAGGWTLTVGPVL